jgi:ABC-type enterochelin transport system substrate-binding protein
VLGVTPVGSAGQVGPDGVRVCRRTQGFDTTGITSTGAFLEPNPGKVASLRHNLIVGYEPNDDFYDDLSALAPHCSCRSLAGRSHRRAAGVRRPDRP